MSNIESGMYVGAQSLWGGLGTRCEEAPTSKVALAMSGLDWKVEPTPIFAEGYDTPIPNFKANVRNTDGKVLGIVTDRYKVVQNEEAFSFTDNLLGEGVTYETAGSLSNGKRVWLLARMEGRKICGDETIPYLVFTNSHDGSGAVKVAMTPIRVICQNTLTMALNKADRVWSVRHSGNIADKLLEAKQTLFNATTYMDELEKKSEEATEIVVARPEFLAYLNAMFPDKKDNSERQKANIERAKQALANIYYGKDDIKKFNGTAYGVIQAVADFMPHYIPARVTKTYQENNFMNIADGGKNDLMERTCKYFEVA